MNDKLDDVFAQLQQEIENSLDNESQQLRWQERIVKKILSYANLQLSIKTLKQEALIQFNSDFLGFRWFNHNFPHFPVHLFSKKLAYVLDITLADIYGKNQFIKLPWCKEYIKQTTEEDIDLSVDAAALFFHVPKARGANIMVLHNQALSMADVIDPTGNTESWPRTVFAVDNDVTLILEAFPSFMQTIGTGWADRV